MAAASAESDASVVPLSAAGSSATPACYRVSVVPRASATRVTGGHDRSAASVAVAVVTFATAPRPDASTAAQSPYKKSLHVIPGFWTPKSQVASTKIPG